MLKKSGKSTESKKLKESVSASKTRINKKPLSGLRGWAGSKLDSSKTWAKNSSKKTKIGLMCVALLAAGGGAISLVGLEKPMSQVSSLMQSQEKAKTSASQKAEVEHARTPKIEKTAVRQASVPETKVTHAPSFDARPKASLSKPTKAKAAVAQKKAAVKGKKETTKLSKKAQAKAGKAKLADKSKSKGKTKAKAIKGKSLAAKDK